MKIQPYFSGRLMDMLRRSGENSVTILVAPTGYGKTMAVKVLEKEIKKPFYWFFARWEDIEEDFAALTNFISRFDPETAEKLKQTVTNPRVQHNQVAALIRDAKVASNEDIYVVLDDIHRLTERTHPAILDAMLMHTDPKLHMIFMGQPFQMPMLRFDPYAVHWIGTGDLALRAKDIKAFYQESGQDISDEEARTIFEHTLGWPAAVHACLSRHIAGKDRDDVKTTQKLLSQVSIERHSRQMQNLLMGLSILERGSQKDIAALVPNERRRALLEEELLKVPLLQADSGTLSYTMHPTLRSLLRKRLNNSSDEDQREIFTALGRRLAILDMLPEAIDCYWQIRDYEAILSLNLKLLSFSMIGDLPFEEVAREIVETCPDDILSRNLIGLLRLGYFLFSAGDTVGYFRALSRAEGLISKESMPDLYGEWLIISMLQHIPDIPRMHDVVREAATYLVGPARAIAAEEPFLFGCPSMWYVFYSSPGQGDEIAEQMEAWLADYERLFARRGSGAAMLYRGELASMRSQFEQAQAYANNAMSQGEDALQPTVVYGCAMLLARIAISKKDEEGVDRALKYLESGSALMTKLSGTALHKAIYQTVHVMILSMLREVGMDDKLAGEKLSAPRNDSILMQMTVHVRVLEFLFQGEEDRALGQMEATLQRGSRLNNVVTVYVVSLALAIYFWHTGKTKKALELAAQSLDIAREDDLYALYVNHWPLLKAMLRDKALSPFEGFINRIEELTGMIQKEDAQIIAQEMDQLPDTLTDREREVATLAGQGMTNPEIAKELFVTESTVKKHMLTIFRKLSIDRRAKLINLLNPDHPADKF